MRSSPFLQDPRELMAHHVALAVGAPMEELAAIHIRAAEHHAELAKASGLSLAPLRARRSPMTADSAAAGE